MTGGLGVDFLINFKTFRRAYLRHAGTIYITESSVSNNLMMRYKKGEDLTYGWRIYDYSDVIIRTGRSEQSIMGVILSRSLIGKLGAWADALAWLNKKVYKGSFSKIKGRHIIGGEPYCARGDKLCIITDAVYINPALKSRGGADGKKSRDCSEVQFLLFAVRMEETQSVCEVIRGGEALPPPSSKVEYGAQARPSTVHLEQVQLVASPGPLLYPDPVAGMIHGLAQRASYTEPSGMFCVRKSGVAILKKKNPQYKLEILLQKNY